MIRTNDAAIARLEAAGTSRVYPAGEVPDRPTYPYAVVSTSDTPAYNHAGQHSASSWRINVQGFGKTYDECARMVERADAAFLGQVLTEYDPDASPCRRDILNGPERDPDGGGVLGALASYVFTARSETE